MKDEYRVDRDIILMGDFNIPSFSSDLYKVISQFGLSAHEALLTSEFGSNLVTNKRYDQILHYPNVTGSVFSEHDGILDFYKGNHNSLLPYAEMAKTQFTYQLSDHLPLWIQLNVDTEDEKLDQLLAKRSR